MKLVRFLLRSSFGTFKLRVELSARILAALQALQYLRRLHLDRKVQVTDGVLSTTELSQQ